MFVMNDGYEEFETTPCIKLTAEGYEAVMQSPFTNIFWKIDNTGKIIPLPLKESNNE